MTKNDEVQLLGTLLVLKASWGEYAQQCGSMAVAIATSYTEYSLRYLHAFQRTLLWIYVHVNKCFQINIKFIQQNVMFALLNVLLE